MSDQPRNIIKGTDIWPAINTAADLVVQTTRTLREYLEMVSRPRRRLGKERLLGVVNIAIRLAEEATAALGEVWDRLGQPSYQETPAVDIEAYKLKVKEDKKKMAELIVELDKMEKPNVEEK